MKSKQHLFQGDVIFVQVTNVPKEAKKIQSSDEFVFAKGEATGHAHRTKTKMDVWRGLEGFNYVTSNEEIVVTHEEHDTVVLEPGKIYRQSIARTYDYLTNQIEHVKD